jgi:hypothetical protein
MRHIAVTSAILGHTQQAQVGKVLVWVGGQGLVAQVCWYSGCDVLYQLSSLPTQFSHPVDNYVWLCGAIFNFN